MNRDDIKEFLEIAAGYAKSSRMLAEAEDDEDEGGLFDDDEGGDDEGGDDEGGDEGGDDEKEEEEEEEVKVSKDEEVELSKSLDDSLNAIFVDIESDALKSAAVQKDESFKRYSLKSALLNEDLSGEEAIDLEKFASETARLIKNADVLLDVPSIILSKARDYLVSKYEPEVEKKFLDIMQTRFNVDSRTEQEKQEAADDVSVPLAVGAGGGAGGG